VFENRNNNRLTQQGFRMNSIKHVLSLSLSLLSSVPLYTMNQDWHQIIDENHDKSEVLQEILIRMPALIEPKYDITAAKRILDMGISPNAVDRGNILRDNPGSAALTNAASYDKTEYVKLLLDYGANIETKSPWNGFTALMKASMYGYNETVTLLINRGANVNASVQFEPDDIICTPLTLAAKDGRVSTVPLLLKAGAHMRIAHPKGMSLIAIIEGSSCGKEQNSKDVVRLLKMNIVDQIESTIILARTFTLPLDIWNKIVSALDLENVQRNKLIKYLTEESSIKKS
jgi:hypothetical protein